MTRMFRNRLGLTAVAIGLCAVWALAQQPPAGAPGGGGRGRGGFGGSGRGGRGRGPRARKVVLAWADTRNGIAQHDSTSHALALIERLGYESGMWDTYIRTDSNIISYQPKMTTGQPASGGPSLANVDAIFFMGHREIQLDDQQKADLLKFVHDDGKGFVAAHVALTSMMSWPEFGEMLGGQFDQHPYGSVAGTVINEDPAFPATKHFPLTFPLTDEFYQVKDFSREKSRVLLRLDISKLPPNPGVHSTDGDFPLAWAKMYGKGRVFYSSFAHDSRTWDNPDIYHMYFEAIRWALGMTDADITPRPYPGTPAAVNAAPAR
ncbi:MAG TPA: ThuA domain-containing protein [Bryobacteraceae bacterium]|nr:ThuA domain-containing protein [Bryobacteraceae bacterium]